VRHWQRRRSVIRQAAAWAAPPRALDQPVHVKANQNQGQACVARSATRFYSRHRRTIGALWSVILILTMAKLPSEA
jgi:hypothetical protein